MRRSKGPPRVALDLTGLSGRNEVFRIGGSSRRDPAVATWLAGDPRELRSLARRWFTEMRRQGPDVREALHDGCPVACVEDAPFAYVNAFKSHVNVGFFQGAALADPDGLLEGSGKRMRHCKVRPESSFDATALRDLVEAAYADIKTRLGAERAQQ